MGNKKKVSIISAILKNVEVLILDEPTSGLDPIMQKKFFEKMIQLKKQGVTVFLSSHNLSEIQKYCDRVLIIKGGEIVEDLTVQEIERATKQVVTYVTTDGEQKSFENTEDVNLLLKKLLKLSLKHLEIKDVGVEDAFLKYYEEQSK